MGRLPKKKVDKVIQMLKQGYTAPEISKEVRCSESTVYRVKREYLQATDSANSRIIKELINVIYRTLLGLEFSHILDEDIEDITRDAAKTLTTKLAGIDSKLAKSVLEDSGYYDYLKPVLVTEPTELRSKDIHFRREWIDLLRKYWPEKLAELVR